MARWELGLLAELGFGLTLDRCASTGARENLIYVSPRSACAVSAEAGEPYKEKLLPLPAFLRGASNGASREEAIAALTTTGYFIETRILHLSDKTLPDARRRLVDLLKESAN
jgi:DNA repair protein RecO (recombination protein O)